MKGNRPKQLSSFSRCRLFRQPNESGMLNLSASIIYASSGQPSPALLFPEYSLNFNNINI